MTDRPTRCRRAQVLLCALAVTACSNPAPPDSALPQLRADLLGILDRFHSDKETSGGAAAQAQVEFVPGEPTAASVGQRILVLDEGMLLSGATRYRRRVLAHLQQDTAGRFVEYRPPLTLPAALIEFFARIDAHPLFVPAAELQPLQAPFLATFASEIPSEYWEGHGNPIFHLLVEANPDAQFLIAQNHLRALWDVPSFCELLSADPKRRDGVIAALGARYDNAADSLVELAKKFSINHVNASFGADFAATSSAITSLCGTSPDATVVSRVIELDHGFMRRLSTLSGDMILVQAGISSYGRRLSPNDSEFPIDCDGSITNRWRVAAFWNAAEDIPPEGTRDLAYLAEGNVNTMPCVDAYINIGYGVGVFGTRPERPRQLRDTPFGIGWGPNAWPPTSSFAAPIGLSYLLFLRTQNPSLRGARQVFSSATQGGTLSIFDPIQNQQFNTVARGYEWF